MAQPIYSDSLNNKLQSLVSALDPIIRGSATIDNQLSGINSFVSALRGIIDYSDKWNQMAKSMTASIQEWKHVVESMGTSHVLIQKQLSSIINNHDIAYIRSNMSYIITQLSLIPRECCNMDDVESNNEADEEQIEFESDVHEVIDIAEKQNWQQTFCNKLIKWRDKNPFLAFLLMGVIFQFILMIMYDAAKCFFIKPSQVPLKESPSIKSEVIINIEHNEMITVIDSRPYWVTCLST